MDFYFQAVNLVSGAINSLVLCVVLEDIRFTTVSGAIYCEAKNFVA